MTPPTSKPMRAGIRPEQPAAEAAESGGGEGPAAEAAGEQGRVRRPKQPGRGQAAGAACGGRRPQLPKGAGSA